MNFEHFKGFLIAKILHFGAKIKSGVGFRQPKLYLYVFLLKIYHRNLFEIYKLQIIFF